MRKSQWVNNGDLVLVSLRDYQDNKCDIIHVYSPEDARRLKAKGELPDAVDLDKDSDAEDMPFDFGEL
jgi:translation initiation factor 1A